MNLVDRLKRDMRASAPKTAALVVLLLIGLCFWVPPLWRAMAGDGDAPAESTPYTAILSAAASPVSVEQPSAAPAIPEWEEAERMRAEDELFQSVGREDVRADAFVFDDDFLPLDVDFGDDVPEHSGFVLRPEDMAVISVAEDQSPDQVGADDPAGGIALGPPPELKLASTLVSPGKRAAVINNRVYPEGATVAIAGRTYVLTSVEPRRVVLDGEEGPLELRINPFATAKPGP